MRALLVAAMALALGACATAPKSYSVGAPMEVKLPQLDSSAFDLQSLKGKVVLVDVWASWCGPCTQSLPFYNDLQNAYRDRGFVFVGINVDEDERAAQAFLRDNGLNLVTLRDPGASYVAQRLNVTRMPTAFFLDRDGTVRHVHEGFFPEDKAAVRERLEQMLAGK